MSHRPRSEIKYQQKNHCGEVLNFFLTEDHKTTLTFCQVIILLYPKVLRGTLRVDLVIFRRRPALSKVSISKKLSMLLSFRFLVSSFHKVIENVTDIFFPKNGHFWNSVRPVQSTTAQYSTEMN